MGFISDLATLVKNGMTVKDIKELYQLQETVETSPLQKEAAPEVEEEVEIKEEVKPTPETKEEDDDFEALRKLLKA